MTLEEKRKEVAEYSYLNGRTEAMQFFGISERTLARYRSEYKQSMEKKFSEDEDIPESAYREKLTETDTQAVYEYEGDEVIDTFEKAIAKCRVDLSRWRIKSKSFNSWTTTMKLKGSDGAADAPIQKVNYSVKLVFEPVSHEYSVVDQIRDALAEIDNGATGFRPALTDFTEGNSWGAPTDPVNGLSVEIDIMDAHIGKLAWGEETGDDYDSAIAVARYEEALKDLVSRSIKLGVAEFVLPIGSDFFHTDNTFSTTTAGTRQDVDSRWQKVWNRGVKVVVDSVAYLASFGVPVHVIQIPGNHDTQNSYALATVLKYAFRDTQNVAINDSPEPYKLHIFGKNATMFIHGDGVRMESMPSIMMSSFRVEIAHCLFLEVHTGHFHKEKAVKFIEYDEEKGVTVRILPSISGTDSWHKSKGYVNGKKSAVAFLYHKEKGMIYTIKSTF